MLLLSFAKVMKPSVGTQLARRSQQSNGMHVTWGLGF